MDNFNVLSNKEIDIVARELIDGLDWDRLLAFGHWLVDAGHLNTIAEVLYFFEKPHKWLPEYKEYLKELTGG